MRKITTQTSLFILALLCLGNTSLFAQPSFNLEEASVCEGQSFEIDITVENFTDMISFQYTIGWDVSVMQLLEVVNMNADLESDIIFGDYNEASDLLTVSWFDQMLQGVNLDDDAVLFSLSFEGVGANSSVSMLSFMDTPTVREVSGQPNGDIIVIDAEWNNGMLMVAQPELAESAVTNDVNMSNVGGVDITVTNGTAPYTYAWDSGQTTEDLVNVGVGDYSCVVTDSKGCETDLGTFTVDNIVGTHEIEGLISVNLFPNPTTGGLNLKAQLENTQDVEVVIYNLLGEKVYFNQTENTNIDLDLDLSNLAIGNYIVQLRTKDGMYVEKLQIQR